jgi:putative PIN family toxin of toxin-antitoxin system
MRPLVLDTNVVLDLLVFGDPRTLRLREALGQGTLRWLATAAMRDELLHVLAYPQFVRRVPDAAAVLAHFDAQVACVEAPAVAPVSCTDPDDQKFIDLAVAHRSVLISKDNAVLKLRRKLALLQVETSSVYS